MLVHRSVRTGDVDEAERRLSEVYCEHRLTTDGHGFGCVQVGRGWDRLACFDLRYGGREVHVDPEPFDDFVLVTTPVRGRFELTRTVGDREQVSTTAAPVVTDAHGGFRLSWYDDARVTNLALDRRAVELAAAERLGLDEPRAVRFDLHRIPTTGAAAARWRSVAAILWAELAPTSAVADDDRIGEAPLLRDALLRLASFALLDAAPHRLAAGPDAAAVGVPSARSVRLALEYIERHAERDVSVTEIAGAANLSVRGLQSAFRRHDLVSPMRQVRETRLRRARDELRSTPPGGATVAAVAARWGFANTGRFTAAYRERFDTTPGRDLASG